MFDDPSNLKSGVNETVVEIGDRTVKDSQRRFVILVDCNLPRTGIEIVPINGSFVRIEGFIDRMRGAEDENTAIPKDTVSFVECLVEVCDHLERPFGGRYIEPVVGEWEIRHVTRHELNVDAAKLP